MRALIVKHTRNMTAKPGEQLALVETDGKSISTVEKDTAADIKRLRALGKEAMEAAKVALGCYMKLVDFVREKQIAPKTLGAELKLLGYRDSRISEIKAIAYTSDAVYKQITDDRLGFKVAYESAKKAKRKAGQTASQQTFESECTGALSRTFEQYVPVAGKLPPWMKAFSLTINGCVVGITVRRDRKTK